MVGRKFKLGVGVTAVLCAAMALFPTTNAFADYGPSSDDVVGVGSDTLQQLGDFVADGDHVFDDGYNSAGNKNKFISIDATADANTRLSYGAQGLGPTCAPGTGGTAGTGNQNAQHADAPCVQNPTVVLRAGKSPTQRPNGSGAGYNLLKQDTSAGGAGLGYVDFSRASSARNGAADTRFDSVQVGTDPLGMLTSSTTHAVAVTTAQLTAIYQCTTTDWATLGGTAGTIKPLLPQVGSGTRSSFLTAISVSTPGTCVTNVEENDPEAIDASGDPTNAIEPMSLSRLNLFQGKDSTGTANGSSGYFHDASCPFPPSEATTPAACVGATATLAPNVKFWDSTANPTAFQINRPLYIYFRHADINSTKIFQPGGSLNWVRTMLYNPCPNPNNANPCVTIGGTQYGPGGVPYIKSGPGQALISQAGIVPAYLYTAAGP